jgi:hypothetical protein
MKIYRIKDWSKHYENNRTRELKRMEWVPVPNKHDGDGYTALVDRENGAALLGCWIGILQIASKCEPRGTLIRHNPAGGCGKVRDGVEPHTSASISRITRLPSKLIDEALLVLINECKWVEIIGENEDAAEIPHNPAGGCGKVPMEGNGTEGNGTHTQRKEKKPDACAIYETMKAGIGEWYRRPLNQTWGNQEESTLAEISRRPDALAGLELIRKLRATMPFEDRKRFFPQSVLSILTKWDETLDKARVRVKSSATVKDGGKSAATKTPPAAVTLEDLQSSLKYFSELRPPAMDQVAIFEKRIAEFTAP